MQEIASRQNNCLLSDVVTFVRESSEQLRRLSPAIETSSTAGGGGKVRVSRPQRLEIPTAVVVAGVLMCVCVREREDCLITFRCQCPRSWAALQAAELKTSCLGVSTRGSSAVQFVQRW